MTAVRTRESADRILADTADSGRGLRTTRRVILIANPHAGGARGGRRLAHVERRLRVTGLDVRRIATTRPHAVADELREMLRDGSSDCTRVIVAGGDGTINAALPALMGTEFPLAIIPLGTLNVLARELGVPLDLDAAIRVAINGRVRRIDLGIANGRPFSLMAGMGFDAAIVHTVVPALNKNLGASLGCAARAVRLVSRYAPARFRVTTERVRFERIGWLAVVANASRYAYTWRLAPGARLDDGLLDLWFFQSDTAAQTVGQLVSVLRSRPDGVPGVCHVRARSFRFESEPPLFLQVDGDAAGGTPAEIVVAPGALTVAAPFDRSGADTDRNVGGSERGRPLCRAPLGYLLNWYGSA
jgi:diacylglycerol kinase (ATP)